MSTTKPLQGMPATKTEWKQHMQAKTGKQSIDLDKADRLGLSKDTVDRLHKADANDDGRLDWDEAWMAFDDFDSNGDSSSVDLAKLGKNDSALAFARGLDTLQAANDTVTKLRTTKDFDPTKAQTFTVAGRSIQFPPDSLAKKPVVDKDYLDRPEISFQLADGTDARLYKDDKQGWVAVVDHRHFKVDVGESGQIEIRGVLKNDPKNKVMDGHALQIRNDGGNWSTVSNDRATSVDLDGGAISLNRGTRNASLEVNDAARVDSAWIGTSKSTREHTIHFRDGRQVGLRWSGKNKYTVRPEGGQWKSLEVPEGRLPYAKLKIEADGSIRAETTPGLSRGSKVDIFSPEGKLLKTQDFTSGTSRNALKAEGAAQLQKGDAAGLELVNQAYKQQIDHGLILLHGDFSAGAKERQLAGGYGKRMGEAIGNLAAGGKTTEAQALQKKFVQDMYQSGSPMQDKEARQLALDAFSKAIIGKGEPVASQLLPELGKEVTSQKAEPRQLYLSKSTFEALDTLAKSELGANHLDAAKALYKTAGNAAVGGSQKLLLGHVSGDTYQTTAGDGSKVALNDPPAGHRIKGFDGIEVSGRDIAKVKSSQIDFSKTFRADAQALPGLKLSASELNAVPPSPETMKTYFAAKYDGQMPAKMDEMRQELGAYLKVAYAHPQLNVPDSVKGWNSSNLPTMADGRIAADCLCMNRGVAHMLSGVSGLKIHAAENTGHARLVVTTADGKAGFIQSNANTAKLSGTGTLRDRVSQTVSSNESLQVNWGMPAPIYLGAGFSTGQALSDVDGALDKDFDNTEKQIGGISSSSADGKQIVGGKKVTDVIQRHEAFRAKAEKFAQKWSDSPDDRMSASMKKEQAELKTELEQLEKDVSSLRGDLPSNLRRFVDGQKKNGGVFEVGSAGDWLKGNSTLLMINGQSGFALSGSGWE